jgi:hypothetical protein
MPTNGRQRPSDPGSTSPTKEGEMGTTLRPIFHLSRIEPLRKDNARKAILGFWGSAHLCHMQLCLVLNGMIAVVDKKKRKGIRVIE